MSAIAGIWSFDGEVPVPTACQTMLQALNLYGPDDTAQYTGSSIALGRCLLRLLPEDGFDEQPLSATGVTALVADVRLDNRRELGLELGLSNQQTAVMADSAMLLAAWQRWREQCVEHLSGAFSFAVWNQQEQHLFLARDHTGERPLVYASTANCFAFASMPKGLHPLSFVGSEVDEEYVARYFMLTNTRNRAQHLSQDSAPSAWSCAQYPSRKEKALALLANRSSAGAASRLARRVSRMLSGKGLITPWACACAPAAALVHN